MKTPILTPIQQKQALSAKKKLKKVSLRNILATPFANYWPLVNAEDARILRETLEQHLSKIKPPRIKVPWKDLKDVPREKRKAFRAQYNITSEEADKTFRSDFVFGVNETAKLLERNNASCILISAHVNPKFMVKHILDMAVLHNTPALVLPDLNDLLKEQTGISSIAVCFKVNTNMSPNYVAISEKIKEIAANYPVPTDHINFHRRQHGDTLDIPKIDSPMDMNESKDVTPPRELYLYRKSKAERVFVPEFSKSCETKRVDAMEVDSSGFLSFGDEKVNKSLQEDISLAKTKTKAKVSYKSLIVKQVSSNKNREQRKIEILKRKRKNKKKECSIKLQN